MGGDAQSREREGARTTPEKRQLKSKEGDNMSKKSKQTDQDKLKLSKTTVKDLTPTADKASKVQGGRCLDSNPHIIHPH